MRRSLSLALLLLLSVSPALRADPETPKPASPNASTKLLQDAFQKVLTPGQLAALKAPATPEQLVSAMAPEQKTAARKQLRELESQTQDPKKFSAIAKGYALLQAQDDALRIGGQMQELEPKQSQGFTIAASASLEKGQYEEAVRLAHEALARNPQDKEALIVLKTSEGRTSAGSGTAAISAAPTGQSRPAAASPAPADFHSNQPYVLAIKVKDTVPPPDLALTEKSSAPKSPKGQGSSPLLPLAAATGLSLTAYGIARSKQTLVSENGLNPSPDISPEEQQRTRTGSMILVGTFVVSFAALEFGPGAVAGVVALARNAAPPLVQRTSQLLTSESGAIGPVVQRTGTVWDSVKATGPTIAGTEIPSSFEIVANGRPLWVHPNATEHMAEYLVSEGQANPGLSSQMVLNSFRAAVSQATSQGIRLGQRITVAGWQLEFSQRPSDPLPVIIHARYTH